MPTAHDTSNSEPSLWQQAVQMWRDLITSFGYPRELIRRVFIRRAEHRTLSHWICELENIVRRAIRAEADEIDPSQFKLRPLRPSRPRPAAAESMPRARPNESHTTGDPPHKWKVSFRMWPRVAPKGPRPSRAGEPRPEPRERRNAIPYAYRIEAARRAITDSGKYALRYARRLARRAEQDVEQKRRVIEAVGAYAPADHGQPLSIDLPKSITPRNAKHEEPG